MNLLISRSLSRSSRPLFCRTAPTGNCSSTRRNRSRATTSQPRDARPPPPHDTSPRPTGSRSRVLTASPRDARHVPPPDTSTCPTSSRPRATASTLRAVRYMQTPHKGILDASGDLAGTGASTRLNIRHVRLLSPKDLYTDASLPPPCRASRGSPAGAV